MLNFKQVLKSSP